MLVLCHPLKGSFNHAVAERALATLKAMKHSVHFHDLYLEGFDPVLGAQELRRGFSLDDQVQRHTNELEQSEGLVLIHPDWWGQPPGLLKGWVDRVFRSGVAYEFDAPEFMQKQKISLLGKKTALVFITTHAANENGASRLSSLWTDGIFGYCGIERTEVQILHDLFRAQLRLRAQWLEFVESKLREWFAPA